MWNERLDRNDARVLDKTAVRRKDSPAMTKRDRAEKHVDRGISDTTSPAQIADARRLLIVSGIESHVGESAKVIADAPELRLFANTGQHLLAYDTQQANVALPHQIIEGLRKTPFGG